MTLYRLDASIRVDGSHSRQIADIVEAEWRAVHPDGRIVRRHVGTEPLPSDAWGAAVSAAQVPAADRSPAQQRAATLATELVDEMVGADALVFAVPLYNFGVSQHFKTWVDLVITEPRMGSAGDRPLSGMPAVLVAVRGGAYGAGTPREGWDHATPWMSRILADVWGVDLLVVETELTLVGVNPALDELRDLAARMRKEAEETARAHGRELASRRSAA